MALLKVKILAADTSAVLSFSPIVDENPYTRTKENAVFYDLAYQGASGQSYSAGQVLFSTQSAGSIFTVYSVDAVAINGSGTMRIRVEATPSATEQRPNVMLFSSNNATVSITISYNSLPETQDFEIRMQDGSQYRFTTADFTSHYFDFDGDPLNEFILFIPNSPMYQFYLDQTVVVGNIKLTIADIQAERLSVVAPRETASILLDWNVI